MIRKSFARRLQACRIAAGYATARAFALDMGIHEMTYGRYERGETEPPYHQLVAICEKLKTTPDFLLLGKLRADADN